MTPKVCDVCDFPFCWVVILNCFNCQLVCSGEVTGQWLKPACCWADKLNLALFFPTWSGSLRSSHEESEVGMSAFHLQADERDATFTHLCWCLLLLPRGLGAFRVSDPKTVPPADVSVSCQIDLCLLNLPAGNSPYSFFFALLESCKFWQMHAVTLPPQWRCGKVPFPPSCLPPTTFLLQPAPPPTISTNQLLVWQFAALFSWIFLAGLSGVQCPPLGSRCWPPISPCSPCLFLFFPVSWLILQPQLWCVQDKLWFFKLSACLFLKNGGVALFSLLCPKQKLAVRDWFKLWNLWIFLIHSHCC